MTRCAPTHRLIGMIQPDPAHPGPGSEQAASVPRRLRRPHDPIRRERRRPLSHPAHRRRALSHRGGACRSPRRIGSAGSTYQPFIDDFTARKGEDEVDRKALLRALTAFLKANNLKADWEGIENAPNEALVNALAMMSPYDAAEKQAMLEAPDLKTRAEILVAVTEIELAKSKTPGETPLQ